MLLLHGILLFYFVYGSHTGHNGHDLEFLGVEGLFHGQSLVDIHVDDLVIPDAYDPVGHALGQHPHRLVAHALVVFMLTVRENEWAAEMQQQSVELGLEDKEEAATGERKLSVDEVKSLIFLLLSIVLWFFGYNAVTSKYSVYASNILHKDYNLTLIIAQAAAIISYLPVGFIASRVGRKKTILAGVIMLTAAFTTASFMSAESPTMLMNAMFALAGIAWATINVNSFPMVVEMCSGSDVGRYTGFYYTASMAAQVVTPMFSGFLMDKLGMTVLFPYAAIFVAGAFVTMLFVRHGDSRPIPAKGLEALDVDD